MVNKVILIGNLGRDPELRYTQSGIPVATLNVATSWRRKGQDGQLQEQTEWHRVVAWQKLAELCNEYLSKGSKIYVEGRLQTRKWQDQNGNDRYTTEVVAQEIKFLSPRQGGPAYGGDQLASSGSTGGQGGGYEDPFSQEPPPTGDDVPF